MMKITQGLCVNLTFIETMETPHSLTKPLKEKYEVIVQAMRNRGKIMVAFSGGVDSSLVLKLAHDALGNDCLAVVGDSPTMARREYQVAKSVAKEIGAKLEIVYLSEMEDESYRQNLETRCYICRSELGRVLRNIANTRNFQTIVDGANISDKDDFRPGMKATDENGFWHPLMEFGLDKSMVREMAKQLGLSIHDKPSTPCLSSRIAFGESITVSKLKIIEAGEDFLHDLGFHQVRVRYHNGIARIEVPKENLPRLVETTILEKVVSKLKELGFLYVTVDMEGYRIGSMNQRR